jgi:hypothetical protein
MVLKRKNKIYRGKLDFSLDFGIPSEGIPNPCVAGSSQARGASLDAYPQSWLFWRIMVKSIA